MFFLEFLCTRVIDFKKRELVNYFKRELTRQLYIDRFN